MKEQKLKKTNPLRYAFGMFGTSIPINMFKTFATVFYVDRMSLLTFSQFGIITAAYTILDAIDNPIYGFLSDRTRTRWGRRRPYLIIGAPFLALCFILFFNPPASLGPDSAFGYVILMYFLTGTLDSLISTTYGALFPELFKTDAERSKTNGIKQVFQLIAMIISIALTPMITERIGYSNTALIYALLALVVIWIMAFGVHEDPTGLESEKPKLFDSLRTVIVSPNFWKYGITNMAYTAAISLVQAGIPFYLTYYLVRTDGTSTTILLGAAIVSAILFIPVWLKIIKKISPIKALRAAAAWLTISVLPLLFVKSFPIAVIIAILLGFGMAGMLSTMDVVQAKLIDEDMVKTKIRREGTYNSMFSVLNKASGLLVSLAYFIVEGVFGFESGDVPGDNPGLAARFLAVAFPSFLMLLATCLSFMLKFKNSGDAAEKTAVETENSVSETEV